VDICGSFSNIYGSFCGDIGSALAYILGSSADTVQQLFRMFVSRESISQGPQDGLLQCVAALCGGYIGLFWDCLPQGKGLVGSPR